MDKKCYLVDKISEKSSFVRAEVERLVCNNILREEYFHVCMQVFI